MQLYENGRLDTLKRQWSADVSQCGDLSDNTITNSRLTVTQMTGLFYMLLIFAGAAFLWASGEHLAVVIARRHPQVQRATISGIPSSSRQLKSFRCVPGPLQAPCTSLSYALAHLYLSGWNP